MSFDLDHHDLEGNVLWLEHFPKVNEKTFLLKKEKAPDVLYSNFLSSKRV